MDVCALQVTPTSRTCVCERWHPCTSVGVLNKVGVQKQRRAQQCLRHANAACLAARRSVRGGSTSACGSCGVISVSVSDTHLRSRKESFIAADSKIIPLGLQGNYQGADADDLHRALACSSARPCIQVTLLIL